MGSAGGAGTRDEPDADASTTSGEGATRRPRLFVDTCSLLDLVRDVTRDVDLARMTRAADRLLDAARDECLEIVMPAQVRIELDRNLPTVEGESESALKRHWAVAHRVAAGLAEFAPGPAVNHPRGGAATAAARDAQALRRERLDDWRDAATTIEASTPALHRVVRRLNERRPPASANKAEFPDCLIIETVFEALEGSGDAAGDHRAVFLSSNTADYRKAGVAGGLRAPLDEEFAGRGLQYAAHFGQAADFLLGQSDR